MTQDNQTLVTVAHADGTAELSVPMTGDLEALLALKEMREIIVHGKPLLINADQIQNYFDAADSAIHNDEELGQLLEHQLSKEDVIKIFNQQLHRKLVGQQFQVTEVGDFAAKATEDLTLVVPQVKLSVEVIEKALDSIATDDINKFMTFLPPKTEEEKLNPIRCVTGNTLREFLNSMQEEEGGLDMNSQIQIYCKLLTSLDDEDPTKKLGLTQMRALMLYGDVVSNKALRIALTDLVEEEISNG